VHQETFFLPSDLGGNGQRFYLFHPAQSIETRGLILYIHPFAEEMNKSRRMAAMQARALAIAGYAVLQIDLQGCGDSSGDFGDATWKNWVSDVVQGCRWLRQQGNANNSTRRPIPLWLWGLRAGCLLTVEATAQLDEACNFLFWQSPSSGKLLLNQFLRLKMASGMLDGQTKGLMEDMRQKLESGSSIEIAGYMLSSKLAKGLEQALLIPPARTGPSQRLDWFEISTRENAILNPASKKIIDQWQQMGFNVGIHLLSGPAFWQTSEIEEAPALIAATTAAVSAYAPVTFMDAVAA